MTKALKFYVVIGCLLQYVVFHILGFVANQTSLCFEKNGIHEVSTLTTVSLHMHPFLYVLNWSIWLFVAYAIIKKKSDKVFIHTLGLLLVSSLGAGVLQGFGWVWVFAGTIIGKIN
jgi:hypothetical protein